MVKIIEAPEPRLLSSEEYKRMNIPEDFRQTDLALIPKVARGKVDRYLEKRKEVMEKGWGMLFAGPHGSGKSAAAAGILIRLRSYNYSCYYISALELRESSKTFTRFDENSTVMQRCLSVDVLCIDDINAESMKDSFFGKEQYRLLLTSRRNNRRPTIATTSERISKDQSSFRWLLTELRDSWVPVYFELEREPGRDIYDFFGVKLK